MVSALMDERSWQPDDNSSYFVFQFHFSLIYRHHDTSGFHAVAVRRLSNSQLLIGSIAVSHLVWTSISGHSTETKPPVDQ